MSFRKVAKIGLFIDALATLALALHAQASSLPAGFVGRVGNVQGKVLVDGVEAKEGAYVKQGSVVSTEDGRCTVFLGDETAMHLDAQSKLEVSKYLAEKRSEQGVLDLKYGATRTLVRNRGKVNKGFFIKAKTAVMGVRGTEVFIRNPIGANEPPVMAVVRGQADVIMPIPKPAGITSANAPSERKVTLNSGESVKIEVAATEQNAAPKPVQAVGVDVLSQQAQTVAPPPAVVSNQSDMKALQESASPFALKPNLPDLQSVLTDQRIRDLRDPLLNGKRSNVKLGGQFIKY